MNVLEKILEEIGATEGIRFSRYTELLIAVKDVENIIRSHMDEDKDTNVPSNEGWISVEERLPEEMTEVLCCFENGIVQTLWQDWKSRGFGDYLDDDLSPMKVIAWQPLPEPYKED